jgi:hypothetical protein
MCYRDVKESPDTTTLKGLGLGSGIVLEGVLPGATKQFTQASVRAIEFATPLRILPKTISFVQQAHDLGAIARLIIMLV